MSKKRTLLKTITWRVTASIITLAIVWLVSGELMIAGEVAALEVVVKMFGYYLHERAWERPQFDSGTM